MTRSLGRVRSRMRDRRASTCAASIQLRLESVAEAISARAPPLGAEGASQGQDRLTQALAVVSISRAGNDWGLQTHGFVGFLHMLHAAGFVALLHLGLRHVEMHGRFLLRGL